MGNVKLPEGWEKKKLGDVATYINGKAFKPSEWSTRGLPIIRIQNLNNTGSETNYFSGECDERYHIKNGDILVSWSGSLGVFKWNGGDAVLNQHIFKVDFYKTNIEKMYFFYVMKIILVDMERYTHGSTMKHITKGEFDKIEINMPPLETQKKIVEVLEKAEKALEKRKESKRLLDELVKSQFIEMFGDPILNNKGWEKRKLEEYIEFLTSGSRGWACYFSDKGEMFLTIKNVKNNSIQTDNMQYIIAPNTQEATRTKVREGDLLISITADLGRTGVVSREIEEFGAYINQHLSLVRLDKERVNPLFISYFLESEGGKIQFESKNQVGVKSGLNFAAIKSLNILVPPTKEQNKFIDFVNQVDKLKFEMQNSLKEMENNFNSLMQRAFKGELFDEL